MDCFGFIDWFGQNKALVNVEQASKDDGIKWLSKKKKETSVSAAGNLLSYLLHY